MIAFRIDLVSIFMPSWLPTWSHLGNQNQRFLKHVSARRGGYFWTCFFLQFAVRRCSEIYSLCVWRKKGTPEKARCFLMFHCSRVRRGRREEGTRGSKREPKQHTKLPIQTSKNVILEGPGPSIQNIRPRTSNK